MSIVSPMIVDSQRVALAAALYNNVHDMLTEAGWTEDTEEDFFWPGGKPTGSWRHSNHPGSFSMDAAFIVVAQSFPKR